jgi:hypothetical protein
MTASGGLGLQPLDELARLRVRRLHVGEAPRIRQRLERAILLAHVGDQRGERVAVVGMAGEDSLEGLNRLLRPAHPVEPHRVDL